MAVPSYIVAKLQVEAGSGLPADSVNMSWALTPRDPHTRENAATEFTVSVRLFLNAFASYLSSAYAWTTAQMVYLDMWDAPPRVPFLTEPLGMSTVPATGYDLPYETALCVSYAASTYSGANMKRRRGRFYLGPLQLITATDLGSVPSSLAQLAATEWSSKVLGTAYDQCVYSRYTHHNVPVGANITDRNPDGTLKYPENVDYLPLAFNPVVTVWCDNAWDTQRRRGQVASQRFSGVPTRE